MRQNKQYFMHNTKLFDLLCNFTSAFFSPPPRERDSVVLLKFSVLKYYETVTMCSLIVPNFQMSVLTLRAYLCAKIPLTLGL